jgi:hypothetical protein
MELINDLELALKKTIEAMDSWHDQNLTWFEYDDEENESLLFLTRKLAFHNYCNWHFTEMYNHDSQEFVMFVWEGGLKHNVMRNLFMEKIDTYFVNKQTSEGDYNSEGMGSIIDRYTNDYLKYLHLRSENDERAPQLLPQIEFLKNASVNLEKDLFSGKKRIIIFKKFKTKEYISLSE